MTQLKGDIPSPDGKCANYLKLGEHEIVFVIETFPLASFGKKLKKKSWGKVKDKKLKKC